jgi:hypothetical protein
VFACLIALSCVPRTGAAQTNVSPSAEGAAGSAIIYIARRGWHIDIGFDVAEMRAPVESPLKSLDAEFAGARYLFFGFGDEHYLLAKHRNGPVLLGALWPGPGMILATGLTASPAEAFGGVHVIALKVTAAQLQTAEAFVKRSFGGDTGLHAPGGLMPYARGPYEGSWYFAAYDRYSALHTCNTWAAEVLQASGLRVHSSRVVFASQLWRQVRRLEREQALSGAPAASVLRAPPAAPSITAAAVPAWTLSRVAASHPDKPPSFPNSAERRRSYSSPAAADCCC